jgi:hypothetical protein
VEDFPWAEPWARVTTALFNAVARLARELSWQGTARQYGLNGKSVATIVKRAVEYGLRHRARPPVHVIGIDEVSRRKGQVYLTVVYDLERRVLLWVGDDRTEEAVRPFFTREMGTRRCHTLRVVCMDMWAPYAALVREHAAHAQILFDRFHIVKHLHEAVEEVRRSEMRRLSLKEKGGVQAQPLVAAEESLESHGRPERTSFDDGPVEHAHRARLLPQRSLSTVLGLQAVQAGERPSGEMDALGYELAAGSLQEIRAHAPFPPGWNPAMDQPTSLQRRRGGNEQQDQIDQPSLVRIPQRQELHCSHLPLLCPAPAARRTLITLSGQEPILRDPAGT